MSTSYATAEPETFEWVPLGGETVAVVYETIEDMRTAPVRLSGEKAQRFADAKLLRVPRAATPLTLE